MTPLKGKAVGVKFGKNLRRERRRKGYSQEQLSKKADLHRTAIGLLENGERVPRIDTLLQLSDSLDISPVALLDGIKWTPPPHPGKPVGEFKITDG